MRAENPHAALRLLGERRELQLGSSANNPAYWANEISRYLVGNFPIMELVAVLGS